MRKGPAPRPPAERFAWFVGEPDADGCRPWMGCRVRDGYGRFYDGSRSEWAYRVAYRLYVGPIPDGFEVCHRCDYPPCVNPEHLFVATHADNLRDAALKGRMCRGESRPNAKLTEHDVRQIRAAREAGVTGRELARKYGVHRETIYEIAAHKVWKHVD